MLSPHSSSGFGPTELASHLGVNSFGRVVFISEVLMAFLFPDDRSLSALSSYLVVERALPAWGGTASPGGRHRDLCHTRPPNVPLRSWAVATVTRIPWLLAPFKLRFQEMGVRV